MHGWKNKRKRQQKETIIVLKLERILSRGWCYYIVQVHAHWLERRWLWRNVITMIFWWRYHKKSVFCLHSWLKNTLGKANMVICMHTMNVCGYFIIIMSDTISLAIALYSPSVHLYNKHYKHNGQISGACKYVYHKF